MVFSEARGHETKKYARLIIYCYNQTTSNMSFSTENLLKISDYHAEKTETMHYQLAFYFYSYVEYEYVVLSILISG